MEILASIAFIGLVLWVWWSNWDEGQKKKAAEAEALEERERLIRVRVENRHLDVFNPAHNVKDDAEAERIIRASPFG